MDWSTRQTKEFIQILKPAEKIINLFKASILFHSPPTRPRPQNNGFAFPPRSSTRHPNVLLYHPLRRARVVWLVVVLCNRRLAAA
jgi:hypothetical protein